MDLLLMFSAMLKSDKTEVAESTRVLRDAHVDYFMSFKTSGSGETRRTEVTIEDWVIR